VRYRIERDCRILYPTPVREHHCQVRLAPWEDGNQALARLELRVSPATLPVARYDGFGNLTHHFGVLSAHRALEFTLTAEVETRLSNPFDFEVLSPARERVWLTDSLHQAPRLWDFVYHQGCLTPKLPEKIAGRPTPEWQEGVAVLSQIQEALTWVHTVAEFDPQETESVKTLPDLFSAARGTAADLSHLLIALLRGWALPARFVSGYQDAAWFEPDDEAPAGTAARLQALHNWVETLVPGAGWRGFDPAFGLLADDTYIRVAVGRDAHDVSPLRHTSKGAGDSPEVTETLSVTRLDGAPGL
jgi:transglutaminase-like putative cysteine protease